MRMAVPMTLCSMSNPMVVVDAVFTEVTTLRSQIE